MACFESGVKSYIFGRFTAVVGFPVDFKGNADISCKQCPLYHHSSRSCYWTKDVIAYPEKYVGDNCPLEHMEEVET